MSTPILDSAFTTGEIAPSLFGHSDLARFHSGAATMRNMFPRLTGGAFSRAGTAFVGFSAQTGSAWPPRLIPFQFSISQGRMLEFGNYYARVITAGGYISDLAIGVSTATTTNPLTVTMPSNGGLSVTAINTGVYRSYQPGEISTLAGGRYSAPAQIQTLTTLLVSVSPNLGLGSGYAPADTIDLSGGVHSTTAVVLVAATRVNSASIAAAGAGGADGPALVTGTTGTGTMFSANVLISGGAITQIFSISSPGSYTVNPSNVAAEPVTGAGLTGATLAVAMGPNTITISNAGVFTTNPGNVMGQAATSGSGTGAQFVSPLMGINSASIVSAGSYTAFPTNPVAQAYSNALGLGATFNMTWSGGGGTAFAVGDWINFSSVGGMTELNGLTLVVSSVAGSVYTFVDVFGVGVDATTWSAYSSGGTGSRIYTIPSPYAEADLKWLKITQSADVMSICCVNQDTLTEYPPYDLERLSDTNWVFTEVTFASTVAAPGACWLTPTFNWALLFLTDQKDYPNPVTASYAYCVTAVNPSLTDSSESVASPVGALVGAVDLNTNSGSITINWAPVPGVHQYNVYKATPVSTWGFYPPPVPIGALFGWIGEGLGNSFTDNNIVPDFQQTPPTHQNPFARGSISAVNATNGGGGANPTTVHVSISTSTGSGASIIPVIQGSGYGGVSGGFDITPSGPIVGYVVLDGGQNYLPTDTVVITNGNGATASIVLTPRSGTYPSLPAYYQQRRIYASSLNDPDTYWMSVVGSFTNFDTRTPTIPSDAIEGSPWTQQVNGIQWMITMPGGIVTLTGLGAWQLGGQGSSALNPQPITPSSEQAQPQAFNGASPFIPPVKIDWDVIFVQSKGAIYRDFTYQFFTNIYTGRDITINSPHMFLNYTVVQHAWCEEPYKLLWSVRSDGAMLSMTYYKPEQVLGWSRHDTYGQFVSVASITEPPVDAPYFAVWRPFGEAHSAYCIERMDNRLWKSLDDVWAVDCGLQYPQPEPNVILLVNTPVGTIAGITGLVGGANYSSATTATIVDNNGLGLGTGALAALTISGGIITNITTTPGSGYTYPALVINDPSGQGSGASATLLLQTRTPFQTSSPVFSPASVGQVIRAAGGVATVAVYVSSTEVLADFIVPVSSFIQELSRDQQIPFIPPAQPGDWTMTEPVQVVGGLGHLVGQLVTGLADGEVITPRLVGPEGSITLDVPATAIVIGLGFTAQLQSMYLDVGEPTVQGQRKKVSAVTCRMSDSRDFQIGANQIDGSTLSPMQLSPRWTNMEPVQNLAKAPYSGGPVPLWTGDVRLSPTGGIAKQGQVALMQTTPLPMNCDAMVVEALSGDTAEQRASPKQRRGSQ